MSAHHRLCCLCVQSRSRVAAGFIKMLVLMVLMAVVLLIGFTVFANWDKDANADGKPDGFTLRLFDLQWYGVAGAAARPLAKDVKVRAIAAKDEILAPGGLLEQGEQWYQRLTSQGSQLHGDGDTATSDAASEGAQQVTADQLKQTNQEAASSTVDKDLQQKLTQAEGAIRDNDPEQAYSFAAQSVSEKPTLHLEDDILEASDHFSMGLKTYRSAFDKNNELKPGSSVRLERAETELRTAQTMLSAAVPEYSKRADHDPAFAQNSRDVLEACNELITLSFAASPKE